MVTVKVTVKHGAPPRSLGFTAANVGQLPADIRVAAGEQRPVRRGRTTTFIVVVATNNLATLGGRAGQASELKGEIDFGGSKDDVYTVAIAKMLPQNTTLPKNDCAFLRKSVQKLVTYYLLQPNVQSRPNAIFVHTYARLCPPPDNEQLMPTP
jgi:hypothetical protein